MKKDRGFVHLASLRAGKRCWVIFDFGSTDLCRIFVSHA
jgi:hypothetical protein